MDTTGSLVPKEAKMSDRGNQIHISLVSIPDVLMSPLVGMFDVLNCFELLGSFDRAVPSRNPFKVEIVAPTRGETLTASGLPVSPHRTIEEVGKTHTIIVPAVAVEGGNWETGRYADVVAWMAKMHRTGALLCSACSGVLLLGETGLLKGRDATIHWAYAKTFRENYPDVRLLLEKTLVVTGDRREFIMSGASASWHDLVLYLVSRHLGPTAAQSIAKFLLLQWHADGQAPYVMFDPPTDHGDSVVLNAQDWLRNHYSIAAPVDEMVSRSGLAERTFKRRFKKATGCSPITYVQRLRVEEAKRRLERSDAPIDEIGWNVGYEDPAFFRRLFKRVTTITPGAYRRKFRMPGSAQDSPRS